MSVKMDGKIRRREERVKHNPGRKENKEREYKDNRERAHTPIHRDKIANIIDNDNEDKEKGKGEREAKMEAPQAPKRKKIRRRTLAGPEAEKAETATTPDKKREGREKPEER